MAKETSITDAPNADKANIWVVYLIRTRLGTLYCGITNNLPNRFAMHQAGKGAKYLRGKGPLTLVWHQAVADKSTALKEERRIKKLSKAEKEKLVLSQAINLNFA